MNFNILEEARKEQGVSVSSLSKNLGVNRASWYRWINGEVKPTFEKVVKACSILNVDVNDLMI